jgi:hypothetical protein
MSEDQIARRLKDAILRKSETPGRDRFEAMVRRGVIDGEGRVLIRSPYPPDRREATAGVAAEARAGEGAAREPKATKASQGAKGGKTNKT